MSEAIRIDGLKAFSKALKDLDSDLPKLLRLALNEASDVIIEGATPLVPTRSGRARKSLAARSTRTVVRVAGGGSRAPYYPWLDFGGKVRSGQRPWKPKGRYIYKAYFEAKGSGELEKILERALVKVASQAGLDIEGA